MVIDPITFIDHNKDFVERMCRQNWIDDIEGTRRTLIEVIKKLDSLRFDKTETCTYLDNLLIDLKLIKPGVNVDLSRLVQVNPLYNDVTTAEKLINDFIQIKPRVYVDLLFRSVEGNPFYVYATNFLIRKLNSMDGTNISLREERFLKQFQELLMIKNISVSEDFIVSSFPKPEERSRFLLLLSYELSQKKALPGGVKTSVSMVMLEKRVRALLKSKNKIDDEFYNDRINSIVELTAIELTAGQKALIIFLRYRNQIEYKSVMDLIQKSFDHECWKVGSHKNIKNLYDAIGKGNEKDPMNKKVNISAILPILSEIERKRLSENLK